MIIAIIANYYLRAETFEMENLKVDINDPLLSILDHLTVQAPCFLRANHFHRLTRRMAFLSI